MYRYRKKYVSGFTLLELMVVVAIGGILAMFALPNFTDMTKNNCMTTKANSFVSSLQFTRSEATRRNVPMTINASNAGDNANEWGTGWTIDDNTATTVRVVTLDCNTTTVNETTANDASFTYGADGFIDSTGTFDICDDRTNERGRQITISATGRPGINSNYICP